MEPAKLPAQHPDTDPKLSSRVHGVDHADHDKRLSQSVWGACLGFVGDVIKHLREVGHQPNQRTQSGQPGQSGQSHICSRNPHRTCNCAAGACADDDNTYRYARGPYGAVLLDERDRIRAPQPNHLGNFRCPVSGQLCSSSVCREWCEGGGSGTTLGTYRSDAQAAHNNRNIDNETGDA